MSKVMEQAIRTLAEHRVNEIMCHFTPSENSAYKKADRRYAKLTQGLGKELADALEDAHADMLAEMMYEAYAQGIFDSLQIARADLVMYTRRQ